MPRSQRQAGWTHAALFSWSMLRPPQTRYKEPFRKALKHVTTGHRPNKLMLPRTHLLGEGGDLHDPRTWPGNTAKEGWSTPLESKGEALIQQVSKAPSSQLGSEERDEERPTGENSGSTGGKAFPPWHQARADTGSRNRAGHCGHSVLRQGPRAHHPAQNLGNQRPLGPLLPTIHTRGATPTPLNRLTCTMFIMGAHVRGVLRYATQLPF